MKKVKINLKNCYGIKSLDQEFDFSENSHFVIYAPNGSMKTSFANTFRDLMNNEETEDRIYRSKRPTQRFIQDENGDDIPSEKIFVIEPMNIDFESSRTSALVVDKKLRGEYEEAIEDIKAKQVQLVEQLKKISGVAKDLEDVFAADIIPSGTNFIEAINSLRQAVVEENSNNLEGIKYQKIFGKPAVLELLENKDIKAKLKEYMDIYDTLVSKSNFFKKGVFNPDNATDMAKNLTKNKFFEADHSIYITIEGERKEINTKEELEDAINKEKNSILSDKELSSIFEEINNKFSTVGLRDFRDYMEDNKGIVPELADPRAFKRKLWIDYILGFKELYDDLIKTYDESKAKTEEIKKKAEEGITKWHGVVEKFNERFSVPFTVSIENKVDTILGIEGLTNFKFQFHEMEKNYTDVDKEKLRKVLSSGERRALYILDIIYEVEARIEENIETLFIVDDIADSFDYKNKYAIIEYLSDISKRSDFYQIILTHNFDFYRTVSGRIETEREHRLYVVKTLDGIKFEEELYQNNPFSYWRDHLHENEYMLVASIPFIRNLIEYCCGQKDPRYKELTSLLHIKEDTKGIIISSLEKIIINTLTDKSNIELKNRQDKVIDLIYKLSDDVCSDATESVNLEKKIVLAMATRLKAEEFLIKKIDDSVFVGNITSNQTRALIDEYKGRFKKGAKFYNKSHTELVEEVNLITPESIHINAFMYEPIIDMGIDDLTKIYEQMKEVVEN